MLQKNYLVSVVSVLLLLGLSLPSTSTISPDDEDDDGNESLTKFLNELERYSGLDKVVPDHSVDVTCPGSELKNCIVNPNGTIVWTVREQLYDAYLTKNRDADDKDKTNITLDGCLNKTTTEDYKSCMQEVRTRMTEWLHTNFDSNFAKELQKNCNALVDDNCVNS